MKNLIYLTLIAIFFSACKKENASTDQQTLKDLELQYHLKKTPLDSTAITKTFNSVEEFKTYHYV